MYSIFVVTILSIGLYLAQVSTAAAYLDPGTGSIILQAIIGGIAGISVFLRLYWAKIKAFFDKKPVEEEPDK